MGLIREPLEVDFFVDPRPLTKEEEKTISDFIKADKLKQTRTGRRSTTHNNSTKKKRGKSVN